MTEVNIVNRTTDGAERESLRQVSTPRKPIVAVDIDDVLADFVGAFVEYSNKYWHGDYQNDDYSEDWAAFWRVDYQEMIRRREEMKRTDFNATLPIIDGARETLERLKPNYDFAAITSRPRDITDVTNCWLARNFPKIFREIYYAGIWDIVPGEHQNPVRQTMNKGKMVCEIVGASYLIDDQPKHVNGAADLGVTGLLFGGYGWNRDAEIRAGVVRVAGWSAVAQYFGV